jgi:DNA-directed RNA polymerase
MQHYAALGGDVRGAKAVNLENGDRPADIYSGVADIVNKVIADDRATGHTVAKLINKPLGRKVVKQTVMTTVYGELSSGRPRHWTNGELTSCRCYFHRRS